MSKLVGIMAIVVAVWVGWPYYALYDLMAGLRDGDQIRLENRVDWDKVRQGLRDDLNAFFIRKFGGNPADKKKKGASLGGGLAAVLGPNIVNQVIETYVTPVGIASLIKIGKTSALGQQPPQPGAAQAATTGAASAERAINWDTVTWAFFSGGPMTFRVDIKTDPQARRPVTLIFRWDGDWRLARIFLPVEN
jgi:Protein of unknown function (DUF2939)